MQLLENLVFGEFPYFSFSVVLMKEQPDQGLHCLLFQLLLFYTYFSGNQTAPYRTVTLIIAGTGISICVKLQGAIIASLNLVSALVSVWASHFNSIALRKAKIVCNFGLSESNRVKV